MRATRSILHGCGPPGRLPTRSFWIRCEPLEVGLGYELSIKLATANPVRCFKARGTEVLTTPES